MHEIAESGWEREREVGEGGRGKKEGKDKKTGIMKSRSKVTERENPTENPRRIWISAFLSHKKKTSLWIPLTPKKCTKNYAITAYHSLKSISDLWKTAANVIIIGHNKLLMGPNFWHTCEIQRKKWPTSLVCLVFYTVALLLWMFSLVSLLNWVF